MDILKAFDEYFSPGRSNADSLELREYCLWLVRNKKGKMPCQTENATMREGDEWFERCEELCREAESLARSGVQRGGLAFDDLKKRSLALADEVLSGPDRGSVFCRVAQAFDAALGGGGKQKAISHQTPHGQNAIKEIDGHWEPYPPLSPAKSWALNDIQKFAGWDPPAPEELANAKEVFLRKYPTDEALVQMAEANGRLYHEFRDYAYQAGSLRNGERILSEQMDRAGIPDCQRDKILQSFERGRAATMRWREARAFKKTMSTKSAAVRAKGQKSAKAAKTPRFKTVAAPIDVKASGIHPNSILNLKPARRWTIVADETGSLFGNDAFDSKKGAGYYVFVLVPDYAGLPKLQSGWHAVNQPLKALVSAGENLVKSGCSVIGIPVGGLYPTNRQLWFSCIETLLDIVLRFLPVDGKTEVNLCVEQRGAADSRSADLLDKTADDAMYHLSLCNPAKTKEIRLGAKFIAKTENPYNGYADLVAFSRGCSKDVKAVLGEFGWDGPCLVSSDADVVQTFRRCLDLVHQGGALPVDDWNVLVRSRDAQAVGSLIGALLRTFGEEARKDVALWRRYLDYVMAHLDSKAIRMFVLKPQIAWLKEYEPDAAQLPPRLRLLWLTAQLAESNHLGGTRFGAELHEREFVELCERLKDEDAPLTCFAALHLAVEKTDAFEFGVARDILKPWERERVAVPGLRYHAQVLSSLGQHAAFLGDNEKALEYFLKAMDEFRLLSADWQRDFDQTCAYAVIAAMDANSPDLERLMSLYLYGGEWNEETMIDMAHQFAAVGEDEPDSKYAHAILLRYLVTLPADNPIRSTYLADSAKWQWSEDGHPWELIAFYRALLLSDGDPACADWLKRGYELCLGGGPTLQAIAVVIGAARLGHGGFDKEEYLQKVDEVENLLPSIGAERIEALRAQVKPTSTKLSPLELAAQVLPFNFR